MQFAARAMFQLDHNSASVKWDTVLSQQRHRCAAQCASTSCVAGGKCDCTNKLCFAALHNDLFGSSVTILGFHLGL